MKNSSLKKGEGFIGEKMTIISPDLIAKYLKNPFIRRLYPTGVGYFPNALGHFIERPQGIEEHIYFYCISGEGTVKIGKETFSLSEKTAICIPPHTPHAYFSSETNPYSILWFHFSGEDVSLFPLKAEKIVFHATNSSNTMLFLFDQLFSAVNDQTEENFIYLSHTLQMILSETYYKNDMLFIKNRTNPYLEEIIRYFNAHLSLTLKLEDICKEFYLSKSYLNAIFKKNIGMPPIDYFIKMKIKEACKLLRSTNKTIKRIAADLGYEDPYYFSCLFKKIVGVSPSEYRKSSIIFF